MKRYIAQTTHIDHIHLVQLQKQHKNKLNHQWLNNENQLVLYHPENFQQMGM